LYSGALFSEAKKGWEVLGDQEKTGKIVGESAGILTNSANL
jgi:hypothetical protein